MNNDSLQHHGILGMKWGKKNGPPYPLQEKRKSSSEKKFTKTTGDVPQQVSKIPKSALLKSSISTSFQTKNAHEKSLTNTEQTSNSTKSKLIRSISDEELIEKITRLELEKKYRDLLKSQNYSKVDNGKQFVMGVLESAGKNIATQLTTYAFGTAVNKIMGKEVVNPKKGQKDK